MKVLSIITFFFFVFGQGKSQQIEIGKPAEEILALIQWSVKNSANTNSYWNVKHYDGKISDVILCYHKQYLIDFKLVTSYCKHYIMSNGRLSYVKTQYEDVSTEKLTEIYSKKTSKKKSNGIYFDTDYKHYSKIYLAPNGLATIEYRKSDPSQIPLEVKPLPEKGTGVTKENPTPVKEKLHVNKAFYADSWVSSNKDIRLYSRINDFYKGTFNGKVKVTVTDFMISVGFLNGKFNGKDNYTDGLSYRIIDKEEFTKDFIQYKVENIYNPKYIVIKAMDDGTMKILLLNKEFVSEEQPNEWIVSKITIIEDKSY